MRNKKGKGLSINNVPILSPQDLRNVGIENAFKAENLVTDEELEEFSDSEFREPREYSIEIDWSRFNENQIQLLIAILFNSIGYSIENWHEADRVREDGADLIVRKSKDNIAIAVKIKPKTADRLQLSDLSKRKEKKKIYVYIKTPTKKFYDSMRENEGIVDFWDEKKLNDFFVKNNLGFTSDLIFDSHKISQTILGAQRMLLQLQNKCRNLDKKDFKRLDRQSFKLLFRLKDEAVSLYKPNKNVIALLEKPINIKNRQLNEHFLKICLEYMDILDDALESFMKYFEIFYRQNEDLVHNSIIEMIGKSHWKWILHYKSDNSPSKLKQELEEEIKASETLKALGKRMPDIEMETYWREKAKNNDVWSAMELRVRSLMIFGMGIESIIDDIIEEYAGDL